MITADQARELMKPEILSIDQAITKAAKKGESSIIIYRNLEKEEKQTLLQAGYKYQRTNDYDPRSATREYSYRINW